MAAQTLVVIAILGVAIGYLSRQALRALRRTKSSASDCGHDDCGCGH